MKYNLTKGEERIYKIAESVIFKKNADEFGGLSNRATHFPIKINGHIIKTTEALYQACRFNDYCDIQQQLVAEKSPMKVKMLSNSFKSKTRPDWKNVRIHVMRWCLNIKLAQNFVSFGEVLHQTGDKPIVENSNKDNFWGAIPNENDGTLVGKNALGRLLMDLRQKFYSKNWMDLLCVVPPEIESFTLFDEPIIIIDERLTFLQSLINYWNSYSHQSQNNSLSKEIIFKSNEFANNLGIDFIQKSLFSEE
jgi:ribA/ribD-fused uncharacterized protein